MAQLEQRSQSQRETVVKIANERPAPFDAPLEYQLTMLRQVIPDLINVPGLTVLDVLAIQTAMALADRKGKNPLFEPLYGPTCVPGLDALVAEGMLENVDGQSQRYRIVRPS